MEEPVKAYNKRGPKVRHGSLLPDGTVFIAKGSNRHSRNGIKVKHRNTLIAFLSNPDNKWPPRKDYVKLLGLRSCKDYLYRLFSVDELNELEAAALEKKRSAYANKSAQIDDALFDKAREGGAAEVKLWYKRFDGWEEKTVSETTTTIIHKLDERLEQMLNTAYCGEVTVHDNTEAAVGVLPESV